jgi:energy-coupling factor transport system permease protein
MASGYSIYIERPSFIHQVLDPRTKLVVVLGIFILSLTFNDPLPLGVITLLLTGIALGSKLPFSLVRVLLMSGITFILISLIMWPAYIKTGTILFSFIGIHVTDIGVWFGLAMGLRVTLMVLSAGIWMASTSPQKITAAFMKMGLHYKIGMGISLAIRLIPLIAAEWVTIVEAQKSRGVDYKSGNIFSRINKSAMILGPMLLRAIEIAQSLAIALESRAFGAGKSRTCITDVQLKPVDFMIMIGCLVVVAVGVYCRLQGIGVLLPTYL